MTIGSFTEFTFTFSTGASPAGLGDPLEIVLTTQDTGPPYEPTEVDFADISLSDTLGSSPSSVPEPGSLAGMAAAFLGIVITRRRLAA
jgi:hypothetical protein